VQENATDQERIVTHSNRSQETAGAADMEHGRRWGTIAITERKRSQVLPFVAKETGRLLYWNNCNRAPSVRSSHGDAGAHHIERMTWLPHLGQVSSQGSRNALHRPQNLGVSVSSGGTGDPQREQNSKPSIV